MVFGEITMKAQIACECGRICEIEADSRAAAQSTFRAKGWRLMVRAGRVTKWVCGQCWDFYNEVARTHLKVASGEVPTHL